MKYKDREGNTITEATSQDRFLGFLYDTMPGRVLVKLLSAPVLSKCAGRILNTRASSILIDRFIKKNRIQMKDYIPCRYRSYNDFFTRKIRADKRPFAKADDRFISPSDGKISAFPISMHSVIRIKGSDYTVESLLRDERLAQSFNGGTCVIIRLTVDNYHRYCYVDSGTKGDHVFIKGVLHTVNPAALKHCRVYKENCREYTLLRTNHFGKVLQMEVGAMIVGKIHNHHRSGSRIIKGQEKGYFEFGGSSIVLLIQRDHVEIANDILTNTAEGYETFVKMGEEIGKALY